MSEDRYARRRRKFYAAVERGAPRWKLRWLLWRARRLCPPKEAFRWNPWRASIKSGGRLKRATYSAEVLTGDDVVAMEEARALLADDAALQEEVGKL